MAKTLQLKFDPNQDYQLEAIRAVVDLFEGLPRQSAGFALGEEVAANLPRYESLDESWLYENLSRVQERNGISGDSLLGQLEADEGMVLEGAGNETWRYPSFTVEMETGTGKTYVYLRTIHELRQQYGFGKFVIVVPSIAIYEGVIKNYQVTKSHFAALYNNETVNLIRYDGSRLSPLRAFASSTFVEIMVMTLASFNSQKNTLYRPSESLPGERLPQQYIQETRPILILDEPQNMESERSLEALRTLHPLFALRYSATHRTTPNLVYRLTPFDAYQRNLVKKIQVDGVTERENVNEPFLALEEIARKGGRITARVRTYVNEQGRTRESAVTLHQGDDLHAKTIREEHSVGYVVSEIHAGEGYVEFENGQRLRLHEQMGPTRPEVFRVQIRRTLEEHMERQEKLRDQGLKVLSLFFIDRVANYTAEDGVIRRLFDEEYGRLKGHYPRFAAYEAARVRNAYFAQRKTKGGQEEAIDTPIEEKDKKAADREAERSAFELIMRDKERLLSFEEPVSFIFAHSALKEGWDNPNVFQICTLNQTTSEMKKRQEIGRGLRLAVNQEGERVFDQDVNVLTVVANESYERYVSLLQTEYEEAGQNAPPRPTHAGKARAHRNDALYGSDLFRNFWARLSQRSHYVIHVDTPTLVAQCVERLANDTTSLKPVVVVERGEYVVTEYKLTLESVSGETAKIKVETANTVGAQSMFSDTYRVNSDLAKLHKDERLRGYQIVSIQKDGMAPRVSFANGQELYLHQPLHFRSEAGQKPLERAQLAPEESYPVPNLLERAARETGLTRPTINQIYVGLPERKKRLLLKNPEGFAGWFTSTVRSALADHVVERIEFVVMGGGEPADLEKLFPQEKEFPQKELLPAGRYALYDQVQIDSGVEVHFVEERLRPDDHVVCYFKFPPTFRIPLPKIVGNYNPDWGILRWSDDRQRILLQLVRETKGAEDPRQLQFAHEQRKIQAAKAHFRELGVDYRVVTDQTADWWEPDEGPDKIKA